MKTLRRFSLPVLLIVALPVLYLGSFFARVAVDAHVRDTYRKHRAGFGPVEWMIDETPVGTMLVTVGTDDMREALAIERLHRHLNANTDVNPHWMSSRWAETP